METNPLIAGTARSNEWSDDWQAAQALAQRQGFGDLWNSGYSTYRDGDNREAFSYSPELAAELAKYRLEAMYGADNDRLRQQVVRHADTGEIEYAGTPNQLGNREAQFLGGAAALIGGAGLNGAFSGLFGGAAPVATSGLNGLEAGLASFGAPTTLTGSAAPLALSGQAPLATGLLSTAGLPSLAGSSLFSQATQALRDNPMLGRLLGTVGGGLLGGAFTPPSGPRTAAAPAVGRPMNQQAPTMTPWAQSQAMPSGLGSNSAGLFDEYMRQQLGGGTRTFNAPTFGG